VGASCGEATMKPKSGFRSRAAPSPHGYVSVRDRCRLRPSVLEDDERPFALVVPLAGTAGMPPAMFGGSLLVKVDLCWPPSGSRLPLRSFRRDARATRKERDEKRERCGGRAQRQRRRRRPPSTARISAGHERGVEE
jgi:hypothetical protein